MKKHRPKVRGLGLIPRSLDSLPSALSAELLKDSNKQYSEETIQVAKTHLKSYIECKLKPEDTVLP